MRPAWQALVGVVGLLSFVLAGVFVIETSPTSVTSTVYLVTLVLGLAFIIGAIWRMPILQLSKHVLVTFDAKGSAEVTQTYVIVPLRRGIEALYESVWCDGTLEARGSIRGIHTPLAGERESGVTTRFRQDLRAPLPLLRRQERTLTISMFKSFTRADECFTFFSTYPTIDYTVELRFPDDRRPEEVLLFCTTRAYRQGVDSFVPAKAVDETYYSVRTRIRWPGSRREYRFEWRWAPIEASTETPAT